MPVATLPPNLSPTPGLDALSLQNPLCLNLPFICRLHLPCGVRGVMADPEECEALFGQQRRRRILDSPRLGQLPGAAVVHVAGEVALPPLEILDIRGSNADLIERQAKLGPGS